jgi:hypothetical protein
MSKMPSPIFVSAENIDNDDDDEENESSLFLTIAVNKVSTTLAAAADSR